ncbi:MAG: type II toxin-antitoxin system VapC family toxin [Candidatus Limnocylindria bacterium]
MILPDSSVWIELLRKSGSPAHIALRRLIEERRDLATAEPVVMEVLAGAPTSGDALARIRAQLLGLPILRLEGLADFEEAAQIYRSCRAAGDTLRNQIDCLIAVPAIRHGASVLASDEDFQVIARHTGLKLHPVRS